MSSKIVIIILRGGTERPILPALSHARWSGSLCFPGDDKMCPKLRPH